jgi:hypothetical protein
LHDLLNKISVREGPLRRPHPVVTTMMSEQRRMRTRLYGYQTQ